MAQKPQALVYRDVETKVIRSDESSFTIFLISGRVPVWRPPSERYGPECLTPTVKGSGDSVWLWGIFCCYGLGPILTAKRCEVVLSDHGFPMMKHLYPVKSGLFQDDKDPHPQGTRSHCMVS